MNSETETISRTLTCQNSACNKEFVVTYVTHDGSGSVNVITKRLYCSKECKRTVRKESRSTRVQKFCETCMTEFYVPPSLSSRKFCSRKCKGVAHSILLTKTDIVEITCQTCNRVFKTKNIKRKFCSSRCCSLQKRQGEFKTCEICHERFWCKPKALKQRFCSKSCQNTAQSVGLVRIRVNGNTGFRIDIPNSPYFRSSFEADYVRFCNFTNRGYEYQPRTFKVEVSGSTRKYTPDFYHCDQNLFIELKGCKRTDDDKFSKLINTNYDAYVTLKEHGINIQIIYMKDFYESLSHQNHLYYEIPNLEYRNRRGTKHLIKHEN